jgi:hypothetical protein
MFVSFLSTTSLRNFFFPALISRKAHRNTCGSLSRVISKLVQFQWEFAWLGNRPHNYQMSTFMKLSLVFFLVSWGGVRLSPLGTSATDWPIVPASDDDDDDECWAVGGMRIGTRNRSTRRKPAPVPLCPPRIPHDLTWARTATVASRWLTAWAMARPFMKLHVAVFALFHAYNLVEQTLRASRRIVVMPKNEIRFCS